MSDLAELAQNLSVWFLPVITAITFHEAAHAWVADRLGDDTARRLGRVSFNPLRHVDPFGTLILPGMLLLLQAPFLFGWAKPVPVAFHRLNEPKRDMVWVALAGPGVNIAMALAAALLMQPLGGLRMDQLDGAGITLWFWYNLGNAVFVNVVLACFNMLPIPPLDGGRVLTGLLPRPLAWRFAKVERYGILIVLSVALVPLVSRELGYSFNPLASVLLPMMEAVYAVLRALTGMPS